MAWLEDSSEKTEMSMSSINVKLGLSVLAESKGRVFSNATVFEHVQCEAPGYRWCQSFDFPNIIKYLREEIT